MRDRVSAHSESCTSIGASTLWHMSIGNMMDALQKDLLVKGPFFSFPELQNHSKNTFGVNGKGTNSMSWREYMVHSNPLIRNISVAKPQTRKDPRTSVTWFFTRALTSQLPLLMNGLCIFHWFSFHLPKLHFSKTAFVAMHLSKCTKHPEDAASEIKGSQWQQRRHSRNRTAYSPASQAGFFFFTMYHIVSFFSHFSV